MTDKEFVKRKIELISIIIKGNYSTLELMDLMFEYNKENIQKTDYILDNFPKIKKENELTIKKMNQWYSDAIEEAKQLKII